MINLKLFFWGIAIALGILQALAHRFELSSIDTVSYLDIGNAYFKGDWKLAINAYWSPLYSWILGLVFHVFNISAYWEFFAVKIVNLCILVFTILCFDFLLNQVRQQSRLNLPHWVWDFFGYTLFLWASIKWMGVHLDSPDLLTSGLIYLSVGLLLRVQNNVVLLGIVLGVGYLSKSIIFPVGIAIIGMLVFSKCDRRKVLATLIAFAIVVTPFVTAISIQKGRFTFGETGQLNYQWYVSTKTKGDVLWQFQKPPLGEPKHWIKKIWDKPDVYNFESPMNVTAPTWYDPTYWSEGFKAKFSLKRQVETIVNNISFYWQAGLSILFFVYLIINYAVGSIKDSLKQLLKSKLVLLPLIGLWLYGIGIDLPASFWQMRYIAPFIVLLYLVAFSTLSLIESPVSKKLLTGFTLSAFVITSTILGSDAIENLGTTVKAQPTYWNIARDLHHAGIIPGDQIAFLGGEGKDFFWAKLAGVEFTFNIPDVKTFWALDADHRSKVINAVAMAGGKAIIFHREENTTFVEKGWQKIGDTDRFLYVCKPLQR